MSEGEDMSDWLEGDTDECFNAICGNSDRHFHGPDDCTTDCPCGLGEVEL
jgi:hypothetical protein